MARKKPIFYPTKDSDVAPYYDNATKKIVDTYGVKYGIDPLKVAKLTDNNGKITPAINKAENDNAVSHSSTEAKSNLLDKSHLDMIDVMDDINKNPTLIEDDAKDIGMRKEHTPPDPTTAKPKVTYITSTPEQIILDFVLGHWDGIYIDGSYDQTTWTELDKIDSSPFKDTRINKTDKVVEVRYYRLRYYYKGVKIGVYCFASAVAQIYAP
jgi:hypothetical protein